MEFTYLPFLLLILLSETLFLLHVEESKLNHNHILKIQPIIGLFFVISSLYFCYEGLLVSGAVLLLTGIVSFMVIIRLLFKD